ncbi:hypothetical protein DPMN_136689 [Dreissena polymorpha]|uniref:Uncharacterized protein n=1 Tax=Dreissena polymorpha TaxID=45954 RepID=A0A9D4G188_DREPO|nr:hypothetical protein DPMN_136689 [Dreissena polymorpha]
MTFFPVDKRKDTRLLTFQCKHGGTHDDLLSPGHTEGLTMTYFHQTHGETHDDLLSSGNTEGLTMTYLRVDTRRDSR